MNPGDPQRLATWVLTHCTPEYLRDALIGDLLEQYEQRGGWWYWRQALGAVRANAVRALLSATKTNVPAAEFVGDLVTWIALGMFGLIQLPVYVELFFGETPLLRSAMGSAPVSALIVAVLMGAATAAREIRTRMARAI